MTTAPTWRRLCRTVLPLGVLAALVAGGMSLMTPAPAADHRDGPIFVNTATSGRPDCNDIYIFQSPANAANTVMIFDVTPFPGVLLPITFDETLFYDFKIDNNGDALEDMTFRVSFSAPSPSTGAQSVTLRGLPAAAFPPTGILAQGQAGQNIAVRGGGMFRAAIHDDPFFFDANAFNKLLDGEGATFPFPRPRPGPGVTNPARNFFGPNGNTLSMILELPTTRLIRPGNPKMGVWIRTERNGVQLDRMGRPAINTALIPPVPRGPKITNQAPDLRNAFNAGVPSNDRRDFRGPMISVLKGFYGRTDADAAGLADFLLPDIQTIDTSIPFNDPKNGFPNGRRLRDDVIDIELNLLTNGKVTTDNVDDDNGAKITDGNMGTKPAFPYVGPVNLPLSAGAPNF